ncbi:uncharacterized protein LOC124110915 [Haliotis rufescens]|uniref:uncharacterized protein LOC124110915 n=1 Tax=Haliotis rufescens TaxID=6454 RepID=UPI00201EF10A|nr:uncharacterized protein LOC124110915 [Haliotis rufescens]
MPPVLENMSVKISYTLNASIATYMCDGNYTVCSDYDNVLRCEGELGWKEEPIPCVKAVENISFQGENSSVIFGCPFKLGTRIEAWLKPNGSIPRYQVSLETKNSSEEIIGLGFDAVSAGEFLTRYTGSPEQATSVDFPALQRDAEYHFVFTFYSDSIQATVDGVLIWNYPHYQMSHRIGSLAVAGLSIRQIGVTVSRDTVKQPIPSNLALKKTATSSTNGAGAEPGGMVDGDANKTCWSHAENDTDAFWEVDLQGYYYIRDIVVGSSTCPSQPCDTKPHDFEISVSGHSEEDKVCYLYQGDMEPDSTERLVCGEEVLGRYVKIVPKARRDNSDLLTLCEVEVYGSSLKPTAWSPFHCGPPPVEEESVTSLAYSATQAVATYTCRDNYTTCDDVNSTVMTCSSGQRWKGTPIKCVQNVFEYTDVRDIDVFEFRNTCDFTVFSSLEVWATPSPQGAKFFLEIENTTIAFTVELNSNDSTLIGSVDYGSQTTLINTSLSTPGSEHHLVFTVMPDIIRIEVDKTEMAQVPHFFESLKIDCLRFENISARMIKMNNGNLRGVHKVPLVQNMALRKRAEASTGPDPASVVDGSQATCWETTSNDADSWWQVDLQGYYYVKSVGISHVTSCTACERYRHDFQVEVYKTNPQVYPESDVSSCYTYLAVVPSREKTTMDCLPDSFGRYVRIKRVTTPRPDDVMALCEVEVFVSKPVKGDAWTPFSCPKPPLADLTPLRMSYTATEAMATYQCQEGFSVCAGSDVIKCNSSAGWPSRDMSCRQTTFEVPGDFLTSVDVQCPLTVGDVLESWVSSKERISVLMLQADSQAQFALVYEMSPRQWYVSHSTNAGEPQTKYVDNSPFLIPGQEWHVVMAFLSEHMHIEINGRPLVVYPHYIPLSQVRVVTSIIGFKLRKVSVSKWRHAFLEAPLTNLAHDRTSTASSNVRTAMLVVDGNDRNDWMSDSCWSAVKSSDPAWWQVDLGGYYVVTKIQVSSIQTCDLECSWTKRLHDFSIDVFMDDPTTTEDKGRRCYTYDGLFPSGTTRSLVCRSSIPGRYTRLTRHKVRPQDEFTVCEVQVYGNKVVKKDSGPYDCVLPPPHLDGATSDVQYTETRMQAIYSCKTGYAPCGLEPPTCACAGGIWQAIRGSCYRSAYRYPPVSSKSLLLNCPIVYSTSVHIFATPTLGKDMYISLRHNLRGFLTLRIFFNHKDYQNVTRVSNNKGDIQADMFPFVIGEEFHLMISYFTDYFKIEVNSVPLVTAVSSTVHDGIIADVAFFGPMAVRELRFDMPDEKTYYKDIHAKPHSRYKFVDLPITTTQTTKYFRVKACKDVVIDVKGGLFLEDHVQFTLGARENTKTDCTVCPEQKSIWDSPLSCDDYRTFWLDWSNGLDLKLGEGSVIGAGFIMQAPVSSAIDQIRITGTTNVINIEHPETCGSPEPPPLNMVIDKYQRESRISTSVTYTCVDQNYMFCGEDNVANCTMGVVGNEVKGECRKMTWHPKERNLTAHWPCKVTEGSTLSLYLTENGTFSLHFGDFRNILLQIDASFANETFTVGHQPKSATETKSDISLFPFTKNKKFHLTVMLSNSLYKISVDDTEVASYNDTFDYSQVAYVFIQADKAENVRIFTPENGYKDCSSAIVLNGQVQQSETSVGAEGTVTCHAGHSFCGTLNKVTCWSDGTWRFNAPLLSACQRNTWTEVPELTQDTDFGVPCELKSSAAIKLKAVLGTNSAKFQMQLLADKEAVLIIKYVVLSSSLTASRVLGGRTTQQETIQNHDFNTMDIDLTVDVTPTAFNISVNGVIMSSYPYESPLRSVKFISISQGTRIDSLTILNSN